MLKAAKNFQHSLIAKLIFSVGTILFVSTFIWAYFNINYQKKKTEESIIATGVILSDTIKLATHYAMMINSREDINETIKNIGKQKQIKSLRIYNKAGQIKFSNQISEIDQITNIKDEACYICHGTEPPLSELSLKERTRIFYSAEGHRLLGMISPIHNEPGCSGDCHHVHPEKKKVLGALDVVISLAEIDKNVLIFEQWTIALAFFIFMLTSACIIKFLLKFVREPIKELINETRRIEQGDYPILSYSNAALIQPGEKIDEIGELTMAINQMGKAIGKNQNELNRQRDEYQTMFEGVPCIVTVQDKNYKLIQYNKEFADKFDPKPGDYCFYAYKGRNEKCENCPVERTFEDGMSHYSEETGYNKDGTLAHWVVRTAPIRNADGETVAAMEMCLDITHSKLLEEELEKAEKKYYAIFNNIPNPVFVLDIDTLRILDCNESIKIVYGYEKEDIIRKSFLDLFLEEERDHYAFKIMTSAVINKAKHLNKEGKSLFVNIRVSPSEYQGQKVFLVTTSDITKRLEAEQQLTQASKMATLGEMATGVAHELNQPLAVIKTASSFFMKKVDKQERIKDDILFTMSKKINNNVDRASKIINHMRQFARKSDMTLEKVQINEVIEKAFEIFSQQLKLRGIDVVWEMEANLPLIMADPGRLEQVFINLLINARDAIETKYQELQEGGTEEIKQNYKKKIFLKTMSDRERVLIEVGDTGTGIPQAVADKIFEPFFTTKEVGKGTGLGLSISYGIIKDFRGEIRAVPHRYEGACFLLEFPLIDGAL